MKFKLILAALLLSTCAFAEDAPSVPPQLEKTAPAAPAGNPIPIAREQRYYLEVDAADLDVISKALVEMPFKTANPLLLKLNGQLRSQEQIQAAADKALAESTEKAKKRK